MAVPAYLRQASKAEYITLATRLAAWTLKWCKDERLFTRRERWIATGDLWTAAKGVLTCAKQANTRRDLADPAQFAEREALLRHALDHLTEMKVLLSIKYEMMLRGFNAVKQASPPVEAPQQSTATPHEHKRRGGRKVLSQDDIDRIFEIFFDMAVREKGLIEGLMASDAKRAAGRSPDRGPAKPPRGAGMAP